MQHRLPDHVHRCLEQCGLRVRQFVHQVEVVVMGVLDQPHGQAVLFKQCMEIQCLMLEPGGFKTSRSQYDWRTLQW